MMGRMRLLGALGVAVTLAVVLILTAYAGVVTPGANTPETTVAEHVALTTSPSSPAPHLQADRLLDAIEPYEDHAQWAKTYAYVANLSSPSVQELLTQAGVTTQFSWIGFGASVLGGCILGGMTGAVIGSAEPGAGTLVGAGVGCGIGAAGSGLAFWFGSVTAANAGLNSQEKAWQLTAMDNLQNEFNSSSGALINGVAGLNTSEYYFDSAAAYAAENQLSSSTWNGPLDLEDADIPAQVVTVLATAQAQASQAVNLYEEWQTTEYEPGSSFCDSHGFYGEVVNTASGATLESPPGASACGSSQIYGQAGVFAIVDASATADTTYAYVGLGADVAATCYGYAGAMNGVLTLTNVVTNASTTLACVSSATPAATVSPAQGTYMLQASGLSGTTIMALAGQGVYDVPASEVTGGVTQYGLGLCTTANCSALNSLAYSSGRADPITLSYAEVKATGGTVEGTTDGGTTDCSLMCNTWVGSSNAATSTANAVMEAAESEGYAYWQFLHDLGYYSLSSIPSNCVIPLPLNAIPSVATDTFDGGLSQQAAYALYAAWLAGLANTYNATYGVGGSSWYTFCGRHIEQNFTNNSAPDFNVALQGVIYTLPVGAQVFSKRASWALNGSVAPDTGVYGSPVNFTAWPTLYTVHITVGTVYEVPTNDPLIAVPVSLHGLYMGYYTLRGNGTNVTPPNTNVAMDPLGVAAQPGAALYLTSCTINGTPETNCTLSSYTLNDVNTSFDCLTPGNCTETCPSGENCNSTGIGGFGWGNLLGALDGFFCWLTLGLVCGAGATLLSEIVVALLVIALIVVAVILLGDASRYNKNRRQGNGGSSQSSP